MATSPIENIIYASPEKLREIYKKSQYPKLIREGKLTREILKDNELDAERLNETDFPSGTRTQTIIYYDFSNAELYVKVHQYVLPNGNIAGSGKPDPKVIVHNGIRYCFASPGSDLLQQT
ncbi:MAG: hypothetical protein F4Z24_07220 [Nitrospira sp. SB0666_bin_27]|nr:hypothetical protein [Nitrospira sp. SB0666_bin_27]MYF25509.1 hypothetical protein [Nitrospira sp. SB0678_bin_10]